MNAPYKQTIFTAIFIFAFCFAAFAQANENIKTAPTSTLKMLAEFNDSDNEWYKLTMEYLGLEFGSNPSSTGFIKIRNDKNFSRRLYFVRLGLRFYKMDLSRVSLLVANEQEHDTEVLAASSCSEIPKCEDCIVIRATDIDKIEKLFRPKTTTKRRKKK